MKAFVTTFLFCLAVVSASAQGSFYPADNQAPNYDRTYWEGYFDSTKVRSALRTTWIANRPSHNWFATLQGGAAWFRSENWRDIEMKDRLRFTGGFAVGRWINPVWGFRANVSFAKLSSLAYNSYLGDNDNGSVAWNGASFYVGQNHPNFDGTSTSRSFVAPSDPARAKFIYDRFLKGETPYSDAYTEIGGVKYYKSYLYDFTYGGISIDFLLNLKNFCRPYNPDGFFNPVMFLGIGYAHTLQDGERTAVNSIMHRMGFEWQFRLSRHFDLVLTAPEVIMVPEVFDRQIGANQTQDLMINALVGLTYHFGEPRFVASVCPGDVAALNRDVNKRRCCYPYNPCCNPCCYPCYTPCCNPCQHQHQHKPQPQHECCNHPFDPANPEKCSCNCHNLHHQPQPPAEPQPDHNKKKTLSLTPVFFDLDKYDIRDDQVINIAKAAIYLEENPGASLEIAAYADVQTGNPKHNWKLSENRVNAVAKVLMKQYGINPNRLTLKYYGDTVQPYQINELNRVAIFVKEQEK